MKKIIWFFALLFSFGLDNIHAQDFVIVEQAQNNAYVTDLDLALKLSKDTKQDIVLIFSTDWCGFCKLLKKDLINIKGLDNKIVCILDSDKEKKISRKFKIKSLPTSVILNVNGEEISRVTGYNKESYNKWLESKK